MRNDTALHIQAVDHAACIFSFIQYFHVEFEALSRRLIKLNLDQLIKLSLLNLDCGFANLSDSAANPKFYVCVKFSL